MESLTFLICNSYTCAVTDLKIHLDSTHLSLSRLDSGNDWFTRLARPKNVEIRVEVEVVLVNSETASAAVGCTMLDIQESIYFFKIDILPDGALKCQASESASEIC